MRKSLKRENVLFFKRSCQGRPRRTQLSIVRQCLLLGPSRSGFRFLPPAGRRKRLEYDARRLIDEQFLVTPWYGRRQMTRHLRRLGYAEGGKRIRRLMRKTGLMAISQKPRTSLDGRMPEEVYPGHNTRDRNQTRPCLPQRRRNGPTGSTLSTPPTCQNDGDHLSRKGSVPPVFLFTPFFKRD